MSYVFRRLLLALALVTVTLLSASTTPVQACERYSCYRHYDYSCSHSYRHYRGCCRCSGDDGYYGYHGYRSYRGGCTVRRVYVDPFWFLPPYRSCYRPYRSHGYCW